MKETALYPPIKTFLEGQGYEVKGEIGAADVMGVRDGADMVVIELKLGFSLALFHQAVARLAVCDCVYVAVARGRGRAWARALSDNVALARRLGLGVILVSPGSEVVEVVADPGPYRPRKSPKRRGAMLREFAARAGDPNPGGMRGARITAYRQEAILCAEFLAHAGSARGRDVAKSTGVARATAIMRDNHYGWFKKISVGVYGLTPEGQAALRSAKV